MAHLIEAKYGDPLPINRQREQFKRYGVDIPLNSLYGYTKAALQIMSPIAQMIQSCVLGAPILLALMIRDWTILFPQKQAIHDWNDANQESLRPSSYLADAVRYAQNQRRFLDRCFSDGRFAIDNGSIERQIRKPAIGRKNFLFSGSAEAAGLLAVGYTLIASCQNPGIPTQTYLTDVMTRLEEGFLLDNILSLRPDLEASNVACSRPATICTRRSPSRPTRLDRLSGPLKGVLMRLQPSSIRPFGEMGRF